MVNFVSYNSFLDVDVVTSCIANQFEVGSLIQIHNRKYERPIRMKGSSHCLHATYDRHGSAALSTTPASVRLMFERVAALI